MSFTTGAGADPNWRRHTVLVTITTKTGILRRYEGKKLTHKAELTAPLSAALVEDIMGFRSMPNARRFHAGDDYTFPFDPLTPGAA